MEQRSSIITLGVRDLEKSRAFYSALGWEVSSKEEGIVCYDMNSFSFALFPIDELTKDAQLGEVPKATPCFTLAHNVRTKEDVSKTLLEAEKAGGRITKSAQDVFWGGHSGYFTDPDGYLWEVAFNPFSPLGSKGEFQWNGVEVED